MDKKKKIQRIEEMLINPPGPDPLREWFSGHDDNQARFYLILSKTTGLSIVDGQADQVDAFMSKFYRPDVYYAHHHSYSYNETEADHQSIRNHHMDERKKIAAYYEGNDKLVYFEPSMDRPKVIDSLIDIP